MRAREHVPAVLDDQHQPHPNERSARQRFARPAPQQQRQGVKVPRVELIVQRPGEHDADEVTFEQHARDVRRGEGRARDLRGRVRLHAIKKVEHERGEEPAAVPVPPCMRQRQ